jgi:hypothetical protein
MSSDDRFAVVRDLTNRRLYQASARVLDAVADELAQVRARTGGGPAPTVAFPADYDIALGELATGAAYQASMRTAASIRQRSLAEFLK